MITLKELSFSYSRKKEVLDRINLEVGSGHICGLLGKNGEGKTTLLNLLSGQIFPDQGSCLVLEEILPRETLVSCSRYSYCRRKSPCLRSPP